MGRPAPISQPGSRRVRHDRVRMTRFPTIVATALLVLLVGCTAAPPGAPVSPPSTTAPVTATTTPAPRGPYHIDVRQLGAMNPTVRAAFDTAAARLERLFTAGVPTAAATGFDGCLGIGPTGPIDGIVIDVQVTTMDGPGNVLGSAGPCRTGSDGLPRAGQMTFDVDDVPTYLPGGRFVEIVEHEMAHVLGIGTLWSLRSLVTGIGGADPRYTGAGAVAEWQALGGSGSVPVEATGGDGTAGAHWREAVFGNELLTGWINAGRNPLSRLTVAALADLGYRVDLSQADPYVLPSPLLAPSMRAGAQEVGEVVPVVPSGQL